MWQKNIKALEEKNPELANELENLDKNLVNECKQYRLLNARNGSKTIKLIAKNNEFFLHSRYDPEKEAERFTQNIEKDEIDSVVVLGFGLGYHILTLYKVLKEKNIQLFVIEKRIELINEAMKFNDFIELFHSNDFHLITGDKFEKDDIYNNIINKLNNDVFDDLKVLSWKPLIKLDEKYYQKAANQISEVSNTLYKNKMTTMKSGKLWNKHLLQNLNEIIINPGFNYFHDLYKDEPIIIVSAGPSLNKNMHQLIDAKGKAVIIAVSTALKPLLAKNIIPDIVILIDAAEAMIAHFENIDKSKLKEVILAFAPKVQPKIVNEWSGPKMLTPIPSEDQLIRWIEQYTDYKGRIFSGGSVAHSALGLAYFLGGNPIIFIGQDLAFSNESTHVKGSPETEKIEVDRNKHPERDYFYIKNIYGDQVLTRNDYYDYLKWFNRNIKFLLEENTKLKIIDATEGGAKIEGTEIKSLKEVLEQHCQKEIGVRKKFNNKINDYKINCDDKIIQNLEEIIQKIDKINGLSKKGLKFVDKLIDSMISNNKNNFNKYKNELKRLDSEIKSLSDSILFFESEFYDMFSTNLYKMFNRHVSRYDGLDEAILIKLSDFYNRLIKGSNQSSDFLKNNMEEIKRQLKEGERNGSYNTRGGY